MQLNFLPCKTFCLFNSNFFVLKNPKSDIPCVAVVCWVFQSGNKGKPVGIHSCPQWTVLVVWIPIPLFLSMKIATLVYLGICAGGKCEVSGPGFLSPLQPSQGQTALQVSRCLSLAVVPFFFLVQPRPTYLLNSATHLPSPVP